MQFDVTASDSLGHALTYTWSVLSCSSLSSQGSYNSPILRTPVWTAPANPNSFRTFCSLQVSVSDGQGLSRLGFVTQGVDPAPLPPPHTLTITSGPSGSPNPVASGASVNLSVTAVDSLGLNVGYAWTATCATLPSNGSLDNAGSRTPVWTSPANQTSAEQTCVVRVTANDGSGGLSQAGTFTQGVLATPAPPPPQAAPPSLTVVATGCTTCHSGQVVGYRIDFTNPGAAFLAELRGGARFPDGSILMLANQTVTIPPGATSLTLAPAQTLPAGLPSIDLLVEAAILEPGLAVTLARQNVTLHLLP